MGRESVSERGRQIDEERDESLSHVRPRAARVRDNLGKQRLESVHAESREHLGQSLGGSLSVHAGRVRSERLEEVLDERGEVVLSESFDERSERLGGSRSRLGHRVNEDDVHEREERDDCTDA